MSTEVKGIKIAKDSIASVTSALDLYSTALDQPIQWEMFERIVKELDRFRGDYSKQSGILVGEVKTLLSNAVDQYFTATQSTYEWCDSVQMILEVYLEQFEERNSKTNEHLTKLLSKMLDNVVQKMNAAQVNIKQSSVCFNSVAAKLKILESQLAVDFNEKSPYFQTKVEEIRKMVYMSAMSLIVGPFGLIVMPSNPTVPMETMEKAIVELKAKFGQVKQFFDNLDKTIDGTIIQINKAKIQLVDEIKNIATLKVESEEPKNLIPLDTLDALRNMVLESVKNLITQCNAYQKRHGKKN